MGTTHWNLFVQQDVAHYTSTVLFYIQNRTDSVYVNKDQPWMTRDVKLLLRDCDPAFRSGNEELCCVARSNLEKGIKEAQDAHGRKIKGHLSMRDP